jgi:ABC-type transporter Mla subunit MlaD|tara:strand:+ start:751 stop:993 length:243 start_codon:yes stop_codon:yes gene_type:complete
MQNMSQTNNIEKLKDWFTFVIAVIACVAGVIFWVQTSNNPRFEKLENEVTILRQDIKNIRTNNSEILRIVGRLEGKLDIN